MTHLLQMLLMSQVLKTMDPTHREHGRGGAQRSVRGRGGAQRCELEATAKAVGLASRALCWHSDTNSPSIGFIMKQLEASNVNAT